MNMRALTIYLTLSTGGCLKRSLNLLLGSWFFFFTTALSFGQSLQPTVAPVRPAAPTTHTSVATGVVAKPTPTPAPTKIDPFSDPLIKTVEARHEKAVKGDAEETKKLTTDLEKWTKEQPNNHLLQAYLGSVYTLDSRDAWIGPGKLTFLKKGGATMDAAVAADPNNPAVRFVRAIDYFELPAIFGKRQTARDDFQLLVKQIDGTVPNAYILSVETRQAIFYYAGLSYQQLSEPTLAKDVWTRGLKLDPKSVLGGKMKAELDKMK
jgi:hypothetical protein